MKCPSSLVTRSLDLAMRRYLIEPRDQIFVKGYGYLSFAEKIGKNIDKNIKGKYNSGMLATHQKLLDHAKQSALDAYKAASKRVFKKTAELNW